MVKFTRRQVTGMTVAGTAVLTGCMIGRPGGGGGGGGGPNPPNPPTPPTPPDPPPPPPPTALRVRRDASFMSANDQAIRDYAEAVARMRALPDADPRSWVAQARIHLDFCPHGNWWFLPWHRAYLNSFEAVCGQLIGNPNFALPYWNWSRNPSPPAPFFDAASSLFEPSRVAGPNDRAQPEMVSAASIENQVMTARNFELFGSGRAAQQRQASTMGPLESAPHNHVHVFISGVMATFLSPRDPLFWLHHCNVDRLWDVWTARGNANPADPAWSNLTFNEFVDGSGARVSQSVGDVANAAALGYRYESLGVAAAETPRTRVATQGAPIAGEAAAYGAKRVFGRREQVVGAPGRVSALRVTAPEATQAAARYAAALRSAPSAMVSSSGADPAAAAPRPVVSGDRIIVNIGDIEGPQNENILVRVFVNCPYLSETTPTSDPHYVGTFSFFSTLYATSVCSPGSNGMGATLDATEALARIGVGGEDVQVQLLPVGFDGRTTAGAAFIARKIEVALV